MRDEKSKYKILTRRALILGSVKGAMISCLIGRFYYLQILNSNIYQTLSNKNRLRIFPIPPLRGDIIDINGDVLANNIKIYSLIIKIEFKSRLKYVVDKINNILISQKISLQRLVEKSKNIPISQPIKLIENISLQNAILVDSNLNLQEVEIIEEYIRSYKLREKTFHVIGYIGNATLKEIDVENLPKNYKFLTGKDGIEKEYNKILQGKPGIKKIEVDAKGNFTKQVNVIPPVKGATISLSIDKNVQNTISNHIGEYNGAIIISDLVKKRIIGMVSMPTIDSNIFIDGVSSKKWKEIVNNKYDSLINKCISSQYHPGSIFKIVMFLSILKSGINPNETVYCPGYYKLGGRVYKCNHKYGHGNVNLKQAFSKSCNVYFFHQSLRVGINNISKIGKELGLGDKTNIKLPFEIGGTIPNMEWKKSKYKKSWYLGDTINSSIGQGYVETTPIQLLQMVSRVATGEVFDQTIENHDHNIQSKKLKINQTHLNMLRKSMLGVFYNTQGTGYRQRIDDEAFKIAGKTGTSQVVSTTHDILSDMYKDHSIFVGYAPFNSPKFAIATVIENGGWGSKTALPISRNILNDLKHL